MFLERYEIEINPKSTYFEFISVGPKGEIVKAISFDESHLKDVYNLGFGDYILENNTIDDLAISDNGDSEKVLATVAQSI
jgi:hypothetical protein